MENENIQNNVSQEESGISIGDILLLIRKHIIAIFVFIICFTAGGYGLANYKDTKSPRYTTNSTMVISLPSDSNLPLTTQYQLAYYMTTTFIDFIGSKSVLEPVAKKYNVSIGAIKGNLSISHTEDSLVLFLTYTASSPELSANILNDVMESIVDVSAEKTDSGSNKYPLLSNNITIHDRAESQYYSKPSSKMKYTVIFFAIGVVLSIAYVVVREMLDNSFKTSDQIENELGIKVISNIPLYQFKETHVQAESQNKGDK